MVGVADEDLVVELHAYLERFLALSLSFEPSPVTVHLTVLLLRCTILWFRIAYIMFH